MTEVRYSVRRVLKVVYVLFLLVGATAPNFRSAQTADAKHLYQEAAIRTQMFSWWKDVVDWWINTPSAWETMNGMLG